MARYEEAEKWRGGRVGSRGRVCRRVGCTGRVEKEVAGGKAPGLSREKKHAQRDIEQCERRNQGLNEEVICKGPGKKSICKAQLLIGLFIDRLQHHGRVRWRGRIRV